MTAWRKDIPVVLHDGKPWKGSSSDLFIVRLRSGAMKIGVVAAVLDFDWWKPGHHSSYDVIEYQLIKPYKPAETREEAEARKIAEYREANRVGFVEAKRAIEIDSLYEAIERLGYDELDGETENDKLKAVLHRMLKLIPFGRVT